LIRFEELGEGPTLVLGFGREGRALERAVLARRPDADVHVWCDSPPDPPPARWPLIADADSIRALGPARVLRSPGVRPDHPAIVAAHDTAATVTCISSLWFGERPETAVVAITGSKGKSTTAALTAHLMRAAGARVALGGNIGVPMLDLLDTEADWFVVELSSYQLVDLQGHATLGAFTRLFPEHQDWHGSVDAYYAAKLRLVRLLDGRPLWFNPVDAALRDALAGTPGARALGADGGPLVRGGALWRSDGCGDGRLLSAADWSLPGAHNLDNAALALTLAEHAAGPVADPVAALAGFRALPHRLQPVPGPEAVRWINDSISTTPHATLAALRACGGRPVLIIGGLERGSDWGEVIEFVGAAGLSGLVTLPDNGRRVGRAFESSGAVAGERIEHVETIDAAVAAAETLCPPGETVLLSPGAPSFPRFRDFEERGQRFASAVLRLRGGAE
jgi:UDP-N-acetylmuramoylalanine--D-glutamate ligase